MHRDMVRERLSAVRGFVFDMDGTLVLGDRGGHGLRPLPGALELVRWVTDRGLPFVVFTNGTTRTPGRYARTMRELGSRPPVARLVVDKPGFRLSLSSSGPSGSSGEASGD